VELIKTVFYYQTLMLLVHADMPCTIQKWLNQGNVAILLSFQVRNINLNDEKGNVIEHSDKNWLWDLAMQCATSHHLK